MLTCEFCNKEDDTVEMMTNPWNECQELPLCETCWENACDNARERQWEWDDED